MARQTKEVEFYVKEWREKTDIDYFSAFVRVYIPFNAWMNKHCQDENRDRDKINWIKTSSNTFRDKLIALLQMDEQEGAEFRGKVGALYYALERSTVSNNGAKITFTNVTICRNANTTEDQSRYGVKYHAHYDLTAKKTMLTVSKKSGQKLLNAIFPDYPPEEIVNANKEFEALNRSQKDEVLSVYRRVNPWKKGSLLYEGEKKDEGILCGAYRMIVEAKDLAAGIIEIIYSLRNALFHGVIDPTKDANKVYEEAYQIMHTLVGSLT